MLEDPYEAEESEMTRWCDATIPILNLSIGVPKARPSCSVLGRIRRTC